MHNNDLVIVVPTMKKSAVKDRRPQRTTNGGSTLAADLLTIIEELVRQEESRGPKPAGLELRHFYRRHVRTALSVLALSLSRARRRSAAGEADDPGSAGLPAGLAVHIEWLASRHEDLALLPATAIGRVYEEL
ncbi:MAG TPA: hypothetical protein V6C72_00165, partial [Chroococcales cyanobacterium]